MHIAFAVASYMDRHKTSRALRICNKKPRSFVENGDLIANPYFPPARFIRDGTLSTVIIFRALLSRFSFESYNIKKNVGLFVFRKLFARDTECCNIPRRKETTIYLCITKLSFSYFILYWKFRFFP